MATPALTPGTLLGDDVEILSRLGGDGGVERYLARHLKHRGHVLLHVLESGAGAGGDGPDMALRELEHAGGVRHPNLATRHGCGRSPQDLLYVAEGFPPGELLADAMQPDRGHLTTADAARRAQALLAALAVAHEAGAFHGALDPGAVLVERRELGGGRVRLLGLGVYQALRSGSGAAPSPAAALYVPPEVDGKRSGPGAHSDLYAVAAITLASLAGESALAAVRAGQPLPALVADGPLGPVLARALGADTRARFDTATAFHAAIGAVLDRLARSSSTGHARGHEDHDDDGGGDAGLRIGDTEIIGFDASLSSAVGTANPGNDTVPPLDTVTGDWIDLLPKVSPSGRHSTLAALEAELAFSGARAAESPPRAEDHEQTRISGPPVPEPDDPEATAEAIHHTAFPEPDPDTTVEAAATTAAAAAALRDETVETNPGPAAASRPRSGPIAALAAETAAAAAEEAPPAREQTEPGAVRARERAPGAASSDVTQLSPPPVGPPDRREVTAVGRPAEPVGEAGEAGDAGVSEQRVANRDAGVRQEQTQVAARPVVGDGTQPPPPPMFRPRVDGPPPGSAFELMIELDDEAEPAPDEGVTALRAPEPIEQVRSVVHAQLLPSTVPVAELLARELEEPEEITSPGRPRNAFGTSLRPRKFEDEEEEFDVADLRSRSLDLPVAAASSPSARRERLVRTAAMAVIAACVVVVVVVLVRALLTTAPSDDSDPVAPASAAPVRADEEPEPAPKKTPDDEEAAASSPDDDAPPHADGAQPPEAAPGPEDAELAAPGPDDAELAAPGPQDAAADTAPPDDSIVTDSHAPADGVAADTAPPDDATPPVAPDDDAETPADTANDPASTDDDAEARRERRKRRKRDRDTPPGSDVLNLKLD